MTKERSIEAFDNGAEPYRFAYEKPDTTAPKSAVPLVRTEWAQLAVQVLREGGENNLHSHAHVEGHYFVLRGRVRFYTTGDELVGELGPNEGIVIPRGYPYWFEAVPGEELELMRFGSSDVPMTPESRFFNRTNLEALKPNQSPRLAERGAASPQG